MITFQNVYKSYKNKSVLRNINLCINAGEFFVLIGSSGCGKTTLLKLINKLNILDQGTISINGTPLDKIKLSDLPTQIGYVVQENGLFPHLTVSENIALTMKLAKFSKEDIQIRTQEMLNMVNLNPTLYAHLYPSQLSGGERQRITVARAFAPDPPIILMDEPFSSLDPITRTELQDEIYALHQTSKKTIVFVTHDMHEAIKLADRICIIQNGGIAQCDTPEIILKSPANAYISDFICQNKLSPTSIINTQERGGYIG